MTSPTRWALRLIGPAILAYFLLTNDLHRILDNLRGLRWTPFLVSLALYPVLVATKAWRWNLLMRDLSLPPPRLRFSMVLYMIGMFAGSATPGQSGDFIKAWYLRERGQPLAPALFSILLDRLFDFLMMALLSVLGLIAFLHLFPARLRTTVELGTIGFATAIALVIPAIMARRPREWLLRRWLRLAPRRLETAFERWHDQVASLELRPRLMSGLLLASIAATAATMVRLWLLFLALNVTIPFLAFVASMALISNLQSLPVSFAGVGVRDAVLVPVLGSFGYGADQALALSALVLLITLENVALGFVASLRHPLGRGVPAAAPSARSAS
jgi:uncharacterized protein (TIRG00374 family)